MMRRGSTTLILTALILAFSGSARPQDNVGQWGIGLDVGGQKLYGDRPNTSIGFGFEGFVSYRVLRFMDLAFALGYGQLRYDLAPNIVNTTNLINADLKGNLELVSTGPVRPYVTLGLGIINFEVENSGLGRFFDGALSGGGGFRFRVNPQVEWLLGADYRYLTGDSVDNPTLNDEGTSKDGYVDVRTGVTYYLQPESAPPSDYLAEELLPLDVVDSGGYPDMPGSMNGPRQENKDMEEYIRLKSRIDELSQMVDQQENEVADLQGQLTDRKSRLTSLEQVASRAKPISRPRSSSLSGFSEIYEEALTNYYNKNYDEAISLFRLLSDKYPNHSLAGNYQYWLGQSLLALERYQESVAAFYKVLNYERSFKKDDSLFHLGKAYLKMGAGPSAKESFARLLREYPSSEFAAEAKSYIEKL